MNIDQRSTNEFVRVAAGSQELAPPTQDSEWSLSKTVFATLISFGYVYAALAFYFMFSAVHPL